MEEREAGVQGLEPVNAELRSQRNRRASLPRRCGGFLYICTKYISSKISISRLKNADV